MSSLIYKSIRLLFFIALAAVLVGVPLFWFISENPEKAKELNIPESVTSAADSFTKMVPEVIDNMAGGDRNSPVPAQNFGGVSPSQTGQSGQVGQPGSTQLPRTTPYMGDQNLAGQNNAPGATSGPGQPGSPVNLSPTQLSPNQNLAATPPSSAAPAASTGAPGTPGSDGQNQQAGQTSSLSNTVNQPISPLPSVDAGLNSAPNEDSVVRLSFANDLARTLVSNYWPKGTNPAAKNSGVALAGLRTLNTRYGSSLKGFSWGDPGNMIEARRGILNYVLSPSMINGLSKAYTEPLMQAMQREAQAARRGPAGREKPLSNAEIKEMYTLYARRMHGVSSLLTTFSDNPGVPQTVSVYMKKLKIADEAQSRFIDIAQAGKEQGQTSNSPEGSPAMAQANKDYQNAMAELEQAKRQVLETTRASSPNLRSVGNDTILYGLSWAYRHTAGGADKLPAIRAAADALSQLANRFAQEAAQLP